MANQQAHGSPPRGRAIEEETASSAAGRATAADTLSSSSTTRPRDPAHPVRRKETLVIAVAIIIAGALIRVGDLDPRGIRIAERGCLCRGADRIDTAFYQKITPWSMMMRVTLYWTPVPGAESYTLVVIGGSSSFYLNTSTERTYYTLSGLTNGEAYWWEVAAVKDGRYGPFCPYWLFKGHHPCWMPHRCPLRRAVACYRPKPRCFDGLR
jgi:hypothetical protein